MGGFVTLEDVKKRYRMGEVKSWRRTGLISKSIRENSPS